MTGWSSLVCGQTASPVGRTGGLWKLGGHLRSQGKENGRGRIWLQIRRCLSTKRARTPHPIPPIPPKPLVHTSHRSSSKHRASVLTDLNIPKSPWQQEEQQQPGVLRSNSRTPYPTRTETAAIIKTNSIQLLGGLFPFKTSPPQTPLQCNTVKQSSALTHHPSCLSQTTFNHLTSNGAHSKRNCTRSSNFKKVGRRGTLGHQGPVHDGLRLIAPPIFTSSFRALGNLPSQRHEKWNRVREMPSAVCFTGSFIFKPSSVLRSSKSPKIYWPSRSAKAWIRPGEHRTKCKDKELKHSATKKPTAAVAVCKRLQQKRGSNVTSVTGARLSVGQAPAWGLLIETERSLLNRRPGKGTTVQSHPDVNTFSQGRKLQRVL